MASAFTHAAVAGAIGAAFYRPGWGARVWVLGVACAIVPDADVIGVPLGIPFGSVLGHRGLSHSLLFAAAFAAIVVALFFRRLPEASHVHDSGSIFSWPRPPTECSTR